MLIFAFILSFIALLLQGILLPKITILAFAPYLAILILKLPHTQSLILASLCGAIMDLMSDDPIGLHAINYTVSVWLFFKIKSHFSFEKATHLTLLTALISSFSTIFQLILLFLFDRRVPFSGRWAFMELIGMPIVDAIYAFIWFVAPMDLFQKVRKKLVIFWLKKKNRFQTSHS
jgi:rod shape-determining protein MreD